MYGCYNKAPAKDILIVFNGYKDETRLKVLTKEIPNRMSRECQYSRDTVDEGCVGCIHNMGEKNAS